MKVWHLFLGLVAGLGIPIQAAINTRLGAMFGGQTLMLPLTVDHQTLREYTLKPPAPCRRCKSVTGGNGLAVRWARFLSLRRFF